MSTKATATNTRCPEPSSKQSSIQRRPQLRSPVYRWIRPTVSLRSGAPLCPCAGLLSQPRSPSYNEVLQVRNACRRGRGVGAVRSGRSFVNGVLPVQHNANHCSERPNKSRSRPRDPEQTEGQCKGNQRRRARQGSSLETRAGQGRRRGQSARHRWRQGHRGSVGGTFAHSFLIRFRSSDHLRALPKNGKQSPKVPVVGTVGSGWPTPREAVVSFSVRPG